MDPWERKVRRVKPSTIRLKYSAGPNTTATLASAGASSISATTAKVPAAKELNAEIPSAGPARPCLAIWWPSRHVTTDAASPGMFTRMEVVEPPYIEP